jgi:hypothetical protein
VVGFSVSDVEVSDFLTGDLINFSVGNQHFGCFCRICFGRSVEKCTPDFFLCNFTYLFQLVTYLQLQIHTAHCGVIFRV